MGYTYVLRCADGVWYIGSTEDLRRRMKEHADGHVATTKHRRPTELLYYEACRSVEAARDRETQLKTGYGHAYLKRRLAFEDGKERGASCGHGMKDASGG